MEQNRPAFVRKHVFIDRKFQGRYMLTFLIPMLIMLLFWIATLYLSAQNVITSTTTLVKKDVENVIALHLQDQATPDATIYSGLVDDIQKFIRVLPVNPHYRSDIFNSLAWIFGIGLLLVIIQIVLLTIFFSHRVAGPVYRLEKACHAIIEGNYTDEVHLRKGDEMKNLANLFNESVRLTRHRMSVLSNETITEERNTVVSSLKL
jgi:nitrate/nitrite-specific signal transduction histidine kinase